jgi:HEAT repeat protein
VKTLQKAAMEFSEYLRHLCDPASHLSVASLRHLHDLSSEQAEALRSVWPEMDAERRQQVVSQLIELVEDNVDLNFDAVFFTALDDAEAAVRAAAVRGLWEYEGRDLIGRLLQLLEKDEELEVRAEAALALGRFVLMFALGHLRERHFEKVEEGLRRSLEDDLEEEEVQARALEAIGACDRPWVRQAILQAYEGEAAGLRVSALHAMGRSCELRWLPSLIEELGSDDPQMRYEAAVSLGSLADRQAVSHLAPLLHDPDPEVKDAAITALGQIGGSGVKSLLRPLLHASSPGVQEAAAAALAEASFIEDPFSTDYELP